MSAEPPELLEPALAAVLPRLAGSSRRLLVGITGAPGAGKSTLAAALTGAVTARTGVPAAQIPMDGFHLANVELERLGLADRKGAPATFDGYGFVHLLGRLRAADPADVVYAPMFSRLLNESIGSAIPIPADVRMVVVEGNYLLLPEPPWSAVRELLDVVLYLEVDDEARYRSLLDRHLARGLDGDVAHDWVVRSDEANARLIAGTRGRADVVLRRG
jgi:pantothenate kinase